MNTVRKGAAEASETPSLAMSHCASDSGPADLAPIHQLSMCPACVCVREMRSGKLSMFFLFVSKSKRRHPRTLDGGRGGVIWLQLAWWARKCLSPVRQQPFFSITLGLALASGVHSFAAVRGLARL